MKNNKPVIFIDFGGVYFTHHVLYNFSKKSGIPEKKIRKALLGPDWTTHATGKTDEKTYWKNISKKLNIPRDMTKELVIAWHETSSPQTGMPELVRKLKQKYRVAVLSSIIPRGVKTLERKYKISKRFHEHHYSYDHGIDKPDAGFFLSAAKKMNAEPEDCIVVDDMKKFLTAVKKTGAKTILFKDAKQLERELKKMGVTI